MRSLLLWMARNAWLRDRLPRFRFVRRAVRRFMPGEDATAALSAATDNNAAGLTVVFTRLGENLTDPADADSVAEHYHDVIDEIGRRGLDASISVKLTQLGYDLDVGLASAHFDDLARHAAQMSSWVWIDMEGSAYTDGTIAFFEHARAVHDNVGLCLQAYLHRTPQDVQRLLPLRPAIRLVKGAYDEPRSIAYRSRVEVDAAYLAIATTLAPAVLDRGARLIVGTHDVRLIDQIARFGASVGLEPADIEVQMLYGIRVDQQRLLARRGFRVGCLIAYGDHWYPWYMRRLAERPANVVFALRQLVPW